MFACKHAQLAQEHDLVMLESVWLLNSTVKDWRP
ncbi:uncharacterized protein METZ01_LOCUS465281 [marine metagenome]|uniref:Uncharacterized protein n=1 Tax=marine metagenome TaxID=408172 RepID=A0A383AX59_9ZZZZ